MASASDGLVPWGGRAGEIRVGHILQGATKAKKDTWEVIDTRHPNQYDLGRTPWLRVRRLGTEEVVAIPPKTVRDSVTFMLTPEEFETAERFGHAPPRPRTQAADADAVALLVESLGATYLAVRDEATGEIHCPDYAAGAHHTQPWEPGILIRDEMEHLRVAHGVDVSGLEKIEDWEEQMSKVLNHHGVLHRDNVAGGFPHRHVPETNLHLL